MKDLVKAEQLPSIPDNWNYEKSVAEVRPLIYKWKNLTSEIAIKLWVAREVLSSPYYRDGKNFPSWAQYCQDISITKRAANYWLAAVFGPKRLFKPRLPQIQSQVIYADPP